MRTIADPSSGTDHDTDEVFEGSRPENEVDKSTKTPTKKKAPPKPKRTFSNSSKPGIKFVSDSFVIEYYTSPPKRSQSESSAQTERSKVQENNTNNDKILGEPAKNSEKQGTCFKTAKENLYVNQSTVSDVLDGKPIPNTKDNKDEMPESKAQSPKIKSPDDQQPTTKVVSDLDSLLLKLAAEVQKPTTVTASEENVKSSLNTADVISNTELKLASTKVEVSDTKSEILNTKPEISNTNPKLLSTKLDVLSTNLDSPSTDADFSLTAKADDEGYCSLSRKPGTRSLQSENEGEISLFKNEESPTQVEVVRSYSEDGRECQEIVIELTAEHDTDDSGDVNSKEAFRKGFLFYSI